MSPSATNIMIHTTLNGTQYQTRKGGRNRLNAEEKKVQASFKASPSTLKTVKEQAQKYGMTESAYMDLACALFRIDGNGNTKTVYQ